MKIPRFAVKAREAAAKKRDRKIPTCHICGGIAEHDCARCEEPTCEECIVFWDGLNPIEEWRCKDCDDMIQEDRAENAHERALS